MIGYNPTTQFVGSSAYALHTFVGAWEQRPVFMPIEPWWAPGTLTYVISNAKLVTEIPLPIHKPGLEEWQGSWVFSPNSNLFMKVTRKIWQKGSKINLIKAAEIDFSAWSMTPEAISIEIGNNPGLLLVDLLNRAYTSDDQIYKGTKIATLASAKKPVNPMDPSVGSGWFNAHENLAIDAAGVTTVITNVQQRKAMNNVEMNLGDHGLEIWVPYANKETARNLVEVFRQIPGVSGKVQYVSDVGGTNTINEQVIYATQDNPVFGRAKVKSIPGMRSDMWMVVATLPPDVGTRPELGLFLYAHGGEVGDYKVNENPGGLTNDSVPHIYVRTWDENSPVFFGQNGVSTAGDIGVSFLINEGVAWASGLMADFAFTGSAS